MCFSVLFLLYLFLNSPVVSGHSCINTSARIGQGFRECYAKIDTKECVSYPASSGYNVNEDACQSVVTCVVCNYQVFQCADVQFPLQYTKAGDCGSIDSLIPGVYTVTERKPMIFKEAVLKSYLPLVVGLLLIFFLLVVK